jgi:hypothetical protein
MPNSWYGPPDKGEQLLGLMEHRREPLWDGAIAQGQAEQQAEDTDGMASKSAGSS